MERSKEMARNSVGADSGREEIDAKTQEQFERWWAAQKYHPQGPVSLWKEEFRKCFNDARSIGWEDL